MVSGNLQNLCNTTSSLLEDLERQQTTQHFTQTRRKKQTRKLSNVEFWFITQQEGVTRFIWSFIVKIIRFISYYWTIIQTGSQRMWLSTSGWRELNLCQHWNVFTVFVSLLLLFSQTECTSHISAGRVPVGSHLKPRIH